MSEESGWLTDRQRDILLGATFLGVVTLLVFVTGNPSTGTSRSTVLNTISGSGGLDGWHLFDRTIRDDNIVCVGDVRKGVSFKDEHHSYLREVEFGDKGGKCVYKTQIQKSYLELYGNRIYW